MNSKFKSFKFWMGLSSAVLLLLQSVAKPLGLEVSEDVYMSVVNAVLSVFVVLGIVVKDEAPKTDDTQNNKTEDTDNQNNTKQQNDN